MGNLLSIFLTIGGIGFIIFIHELGHYLAARAVGVRVEAFSIGFGPRLFGWTRGPTDYKLCAIPLGGYVKMAGEDPTRPTTGRPDEFGSKKVWQRVLVISAGVIMNLLFALIAIPVAFSVGIPFEEPVVGSVSPGSPAWAAGIRRGDRVLAVAERPVIQFGDLVTDIAVHDGDVPLRIERGAETLELVVEPRDLGRGMPQIGIGPAMANRASVLGEDAIKSEVPEPEAALRALAGLRSAGVNPEDSVLALNGISLADLPWVALELSDAEPGEPLVFSVERDGVTQHISVPPITEPDRDSPPRLGVVWGGPQVAHVRGVAASELRPGDVILRVQGEEVTTRRAFIRSVGDGLHPFVTTSLPPLKTPDLKLEVLSPSESESGAPTARSVTIPLPTWDARRRFLEDLSFGQPDSLTVWVTPGSPMARAGFRSGDTVSALDGVPVTGREQVSEILASNPTGTHSVRVRRGMQTLEAPVQPEPAEENLIASRAMLDHTFRTYVARESFGSSFRTGLLQTTRNVRRIFQTLGSLLRGSVDKKHLGGIITIFRASKAQTNIAFSRGLLFLAIVSINLAILNILPIPVLDGGWLMFLLIEKIKGSPVSERTMGAFQWAGLAMVLSLMVFATWNDITRLFE